MAPIIYLKFKDSGILPFDSDILSIESNLFKLFIDEGNIGVDNPVYINYYKLNFDILLGILSDNCEEKNIEMLLDIMKLASYIQLSGQNMRKVATYYNNTVNESIQESELKLPTEVKDYIKDTRKVYVIDHTSSNNDDPSINSQCNIYKDTNFYDVFNNFKIFTKNHYTFMNKKTNKFIHKVLSVYEKHINSIILKYKDYLLATDNTLVQNIIALIELLHNDSKELDVMTLKICAKLAIAKSHICFSDLILVIDYENIGIGIKFEDEYDEEDELDEDEYSEGNDIINESDYNSDALIAINVNIIEGEIYKLTIMRLSERHCNFDKYSLNVI